ncbi:MAG: Na+/H+ antiporter NhaC family protein [Vicingaceae bacterium]
MGRLLAIFLLFFVSISQLLAQEIQFPEFIIAGQKSEVRLIGEFEETPLLYFNGKEADLIKSETGYFFQFKSEEDCHLKVQTQEEVFEKTLHPIPLWLSLIPPLLAILLALLIREVVSSLLIGLFAGCVIIYTHIYTGLSAWIHAFMHLLDEYLLSALNNGGHLSIISFSMMIGGMVAIISKNGGMQGVVDRISKYATSARSGQLATWFLGIAIFFDDYANTLIVGNTMRPITDKFKISREKLAYLVDSTAAPIAAIAFVTTWIGAELGYIESGISKIPELNEGVYATFISSLAYSFYPIFALLFMLFLILKGKDFGPMLKAERASRANTETLAETKVEGIEEFTAKDDIDHKAYDAIIPILVVISGTLMGLLYTGWDASVWQDTSLSWSNKLSTIIGQADSYQALLWSSAAGLITAVKLSVLQRKLDLKESIDAAFDGFKTMLPAIVILILAWSLAKVIEDLHTADLLTSLMSENIDASFVPAITFILAALVAFSTGSSWGTMAILYPLMLPAAWKISQSCGLDYEQSLAIFHNVVSCVLAGSVLGDHCSPISDTTILSSLASNCDHIQHVKTQMPYALVVGLVALLIGTLPSAFGVPSWICMIIGLTVLYLVVHFGGKKTELN